MVQILNMVILWFKALGKEKNYDRRKQWGLRLCMKMFWAILAYCYANSAFLMKSHTSIIHKE